MELFLCNPHSANNLVAGVFKDKLILFSASLECNLADQFDSGLQYHDTLHSAIPVTFQSR